MIRLFVMTTNIEHQALSSPTKLYRIHPPSPPSLTVATAFLLETITPPEKVRTLSLSLEGDDGPTAGSPILPLPENDELCRHRHRHDITTGTRQDHVTEHTYIHTRKRKV